MAEVLDVAVGGRIWWEGATWQVDELRDGAALLSRGGSVRRMTLSALLRAEASAIDDGGTVGDGSFPSVELLANLGPRERRRLESTVKAITEALEQRPQDPATHLAHAAGLSERTARRRISAFRTHGPAGLVDQRRSASGRSNAIPEEWNRALRDVLTRHRDLSTPSLSLVIDQANSLAETQSPGLALPARATAYRHLREVTAGTAAFGSAKRRRSDAARPQGVLGSLRADRPGQYVVLDSTPLDVFAAEPVTDRWVPVELTVAMDLYSRCITGLRLRPISTRSREVADVLYQTITAQTWGPEAGEGPYVGVPEVVVFETGTVPDTIIVDHGRAYLSEHVKAVCARLGISIQPATPRKPTDKPTIERFFRTLRQGFLERLPAYKGPDVYSRGKDIEKQAFLYVPELEQALREWVGIYHDTPHEGLCDPRLPHVELTPAQMFQRGLAIAGRIRLPVSTSLAMEFLEVAWRKIHHYGITIGGRRYDGPELNLYRGQRSEHGGLHAGKWPFYVDRNDVRAIHFQDPATEQWAAIGWDRARDLDAPFSAEAADYVRALQLASPDRSVDPKEAVGELVERYSQQNVTMRRAENNLARHITTTAPDGDRDPRRTPTGSRGELNVLHEHLERRARVRVADDMDVFERYGNDDEDRFEVFEG